MSIIALRKREDGVVAECCSRYDAEHDRLLWMFIREDETVLHPRATSL